MNFINRHEVYSNIIYSYELSFCFRTNLEPGSGFSSIFNTIIIFITIDSITIRLNILQILLLWI